METKSKREVNLTKDFMLSTIIPIAKRYIISDLWEDGKSVKFIEDWSDRDWYEGEPQVTVSLTVNDEVIVSATNTDSELCMYYLITRYKEMKNVDNTKD